MKSDNIAVFYIGTHTNNPQNGIYLGRFDCQTGEIISIDLAAEALNPNFLAIAADKKYLYSVGNDQLENNSDNGCVNAYSIIDNKKLELLNKTSSCGKTPCHISIGNNGRLVIVSNYSSGSLAAIPIDDNGYLKPAAKTIHHSGRSVNTARQESAHIHSVFIDNNNKFALAVDLGLDRIYSYKLNDISNPLVPNANMEFVQVEGGNGPRHFAFSRCGNLGYVINELSNTITAFSYNQDSGTLKQIQQISTIPADYNSTTYTSEIQVHPNGKFLYGSNRGHNSICIFHINPNSGLLSLVEITPCGGDFPRHFAIDPTGKWLLAANERSSLITVFAIDTETGKISENNSYDIKSPVCIKFW